MGSHTKQPRKYLTTQRSITRTFDPDVPTGSFVQVGEKETNTNAHFSVLKGQIVPSQSVARLPHLLIELH